MLILLTSMTAACFVFRKPPLTKIIFVALLLLSLAGFLVNALAPGTAIRQQIIQEGWGKPEAGAAIVNSFLYAAKDIDIWLLHDFRIMSALLFLTPVFYTMAQKTNYLFKYPLLVVFFSFCLFAAMYAPTAYVFGDLKLTRVMNIIYFAFVLLVFLNYFYFIGYMARLVREGQITLSRSFLVRCAYVACAFALVFVFCSASRYRQHTSVTAARDLYSGRARQYSLEMNERYKILHDANIKQAELPPLSVWPALLFLGDITTDKDNWWNERVARFYQKEYVVVNEELSHSP
jgi:hypothetical protein